MATLFRKIRMRRDTQANFAGVVLSAGEFGFITDTGLLYIGNGSDDVGGDLIPVNGGLIVDSLFEMATARVLGRVTAGTGGIEELAYVPVILGGTGFTGGYTKGDLLVATGPTTLVRVPVGTDDQILRANSAETAGVKWEDEATFDGMANPMTAAGSLIFGGTGGIPQELAVSTMDLPGYSLQLDTNLMPYWGPQASGFENPMTTFGSIIVAGTGGEAVERLAGDELDVLTMLDGEPVWLPPQAGLPSTSGASPGDTLQLDTSLDAYWGPPSGGSGGSSNIITVRSFL